jgi:hypothetical protein
VVGSLWSRRSLDRRRSARGATGARACAPARAIERATSQSASTRYPPWRSPPTGQPSRSAWRRLVRCGTRPPARKALESGSSRARAPRCCEGPRPAKRKGRQSTPGHLCHRGYVTGMTVSAQCPACVVGRVGRHAEMREQFNSAGSTSRGGPTLLGATGVSVDRFRPGGSGTSAEVGRCASVRRRFGRRGATHWAHPRRASS